MNSNTIIVIALLLLAPLALWWGTWLLLAIAALFRTRTTSTPTPIQIDILIPAHNEANQLPALLSSLAQQNPAFRGQVLVVADHCNDDTAAIARSFGVTVVERHAGPRGKPAALATGLAALRTINHVRPLCILDADCVVNDTFLPALAGQLQLDANVVQANYQLTAGHGELHGPAMIAFALKNAVRARGAHNLGVPVQLFGTGMCFDTQTAASLQFENHLTEDLALSYDLLLAGKRMALADDARVTSPLPENHAGLNTQKMRWEQGQITLWRKLPGRLLHLLLRGKLRAALAVIDWSAPPLALACLYFVAASIVITALSLIFRVLHLLWLPPAVAMLLIAYILIGTLQCGGPAALFTLLRRVPQFIFWKCTLYARMLTGRGARGWQRTERDSPGLAKT